MNDANKNPESGVAMLMALVTMLLLSILAGELVYQSGVFSSVVFRQRDQFQATLLARSGLRLALLQLRATKKAKAKTKEMGLGENVGIVDKIWQMPLVLPPPAVPGLSPGDTAALNDFRKALGFSGTVSVTIMGENSRMNVNQLVWPGTGAKQGGVPGVSTGGDEIDPNDPTKLKNPNSGSALSPALSPEQKAEQKKKKRESFVVLFNSLLEKKRLSDDSFREKYSNINGEQLVGHLSAWMDPETKEDGDNRDKLDYYQRAEPIPYALKNAPIASDTEFHMVKGFDEVIAKLVADNFTLHATSGVDVNKATMLLIQSLIPELTPDAIERIEKRRNDTALGGPFKDEAEFWTFLSTLGSYEDAKKRLAESGIKILEGDTSFRAIIVAQSGVATKTWLADIGPLPPKIDDAAPGTAPAQPAPQPIPDPDESGNSTSTSTSTSTTTETGDTDSLSIVYLKAE